MIQSFQCPVCGTLNAIGEPECTDCGQGFVYNCPVCGSSLNNRYTNCPNCRTAFNWAVSRPQNPPDADSKNTLSSVAQQEAPPAPKAIRQRREKGAVITSRPMFWAMLIVICAVLIALLFIADGLINA
jgi:predicted amidophosphoribosyltransferase